MRKTSVDLSALNVNPSQPPAFWTDDLKRMTYHKAKKWFDSDTGVIVDLILMLDADKLLAFADDGTITAIGTLNSDNLIADVHWQSSVKIPVSVWSLCHGHSVPSICHVAFDSSTQLFFFTLSPPEAGVFTVPYDAIEFEGLRRIQTGEFVPAVAFSTPVSRTIGRRTSIDSSYSPDASPMSSPSESGPPASPQAGQRGDMESNMSNISGSKIKASEPRYSSMKRPVNADRTMKTLIAKQKLNDDHFRWFFGMAISKELLFVCHRFRPNSIGIWSLGNTSKGLLLAEIQDVQNDNLADFQPLTCSVLSEGFGVIELAVIDSRHIVFSLEVNTPVSAMGWKFKQMISSIAGQEPGKLKFPIRLFHSPEQEELWIVDGVNYRNQVFKRTKSEPWELTWTSPEIKNTVIPAAAGNVSVILHAEKAKPQGPQHPWITATVIPKDLRGKRYVISALSSNEIVCFGYPM